MSRLAPSHTVNTKRKDPRQPMRLPEVWTMRSQTSKTQSHANFCRWEVQPYATFNPELQDLELHQLLQMRVQPSATIQIVSSKTQSHAFFCRWQVNYLQLLGASSNTQEPYQISQMSNQTSAHFICVFKIKIMPALQSLKSVVRVKGTLCQMPLHEWSQLKVLAKKASSRHARAIFWVARAQQRWFTSF